MKLINWAIGITIVSITALGIIKLSGNLPDDLTTRYQVYTLGGDTFDLDVKVLITEDTAWAVKYVRQNLDSTVKSSDFDGRGATFGSIDGKSPIIWLPTTDDASIVNHELIHATINVMQWAGIVLNDSTEEVYGYEMQHLTKEFYNQITKIKQNAYTTRK